MKLDQATIDELVAKGATLGPRPLLGMPEHIKEGLQAERPKQMVEAGVSIEDGRMVILVPTETKSEPNMRDWRAKAKRTKSAKMILFGALAPYHGILTLFVQRLHAAHEALRITFTRLGGRELDDDNLRGAMKASRDAVASLLLTDDRDPKLHWLYEQETSGPVGVRVVIEAYR